MNVNNKKLAEAIERTHGGKAVFLESVAVSETFQGLVVWEGFVSVFELSGHPTVKVAYAWSSPIRGSTKRRYFAVLQGEGIQTPTDAVRAAIVAEHQKKTS